MILLNLEGTTRLHSLIGRTGEIKNPDGNRAVSFVGAGTPHAHLLLSAPAGTAHDPGSPNSPLRAMQAAADTGRGNGPTLELSVGMPDIFEMRGETLPGGDAEYSLKLWPIGQAEPSDWGITYVTNTPPVVGSLLLVAHHLDVTFGDVAIVPVGN